MQLPSRGLFARAKYPPLNSRMLTLPDQEINVETGIARLARWAGATDETARTSTGVTMSEVKLVSGRFRSVTLADKAEHVNRLRAMCAEAEPGREYSLREIGDFCGVSHEAVRQWERRALQRVRRLLLTHGFKDMAGDFRHHLNG